MSFPKHKNKFLALPLTAFLMVLSCLTACKDKAPAEKCEHDEAAEKMFEGVWLNEDDNSVAFRAENDTVYYCDSTSLPMHYRITDGTIFMEGSDTVSYPIVKQTEHLFVFKNGVGDVVRLVKTNDKEYRKLFEKHGAVSVLNQNKLIKRDTVLTYNDVRYHSYVQVNPTTYKVIKSSYNNDGVKVENVYYDNIIHVSVFHLTRQMFSKDFTKSDFRKYVPGEFLSQSILSDMEFVSCGDDGFNYRAVLYIPDSMTSFIVDVNFSFRGKLTMKVADKAQSN